MARMAAFRFTVRDDPVLEAHVRRHIGARRFAYNRCLEAVKDTLAERRASPDVEVPSSGYSLINWWNGWKRSEDAGCLVAVDPSGRAELVEVGLSWRTEVSAQVFEEAAVDLGRALAAFSASKKGARGAARGHAAPAPHAAPGSRRVAAGQDLFGHVVTAARPHRRHRRQSLWREERWPSPR